MGASSSMAEGGLYAVIEDPFGASLCLFLIGMFFARKLYRMDILTFGDFYREKYGKWMELAASICLVLSYIGWIAAQMVALAAQEAKAAGCEWLHVDFEPHLKRFYIQGCGFRATDAGLSALT